jgi:hypothetical protein
MYLEDHVLATLAALASTKESICRCAVNGLLRTHFELTELGRLL